MINIAQSLATIVFYANLTGMIELCLANKGGEDCDRAGSLYFYDRIGKALIEAKDEEGEEKLVEDEDYDDIKMSVFRTKRAAQAVAVRRYSRHLRLFASATWSE